MDFSDSTKEPACSAENFYCLLKVRTVIDYVRSRCQNNFKPTKNISVDEGMIAFRGRLSFKQYIPTKPTMYSIKVWMAADSSNRYVLNFDFYLGKEANQCGIYGLGLPAAKIKLPLLRIELQNKFARFKAVLLTIT